MNKIAYLFGGTPDELATKVNQLFELSGGGEPVGAIQQHAVNRYSQTLMLPADKPKPAKAPAKKTTKKPAEPTKAGNPNGDDS